jgi:hypothetical protein
MIEEKVQRMNRIAMVLFVASAMVFVFFHFLPWSNTGMRRLGWEIWPFLMDVQNFMGTSLLPSSGFVANALLTLSSPFLMRIFPVSRLVRRFCQVVSIMAFVSLSGYLIWSLRRGTLPGPGMTCLMVGQLLHLAGSLCLRGVPPTEDPFRCET